MGKLEVALQRYARGFEKLRRHSLLEFSAFVLNRRLVYSPISTQSLRTQWYEPSSPRTLHYIL